MSKQIFLAILISLSGSILLGADPQLKPSEANAKVNTIESFNKLFDLAQSSAAQSKFTGCIDVDDSIGTTVVAAPVDDESQQILKLAEKLYQKNIDSMTQKQRFDLLGLIASNNMELFPFMKEDHVHQCADQFMQKLSPEDVATLSKYYIDAEIHLVLGYANSLAPRFFEAEASE